MLSYKKHYPPCPPRQRRTSVARKNSGDYRRDCSLSPPSMRFSALSLENRHHHCLLMNALLVSYPHYHLLSTTSLPLNERFVGFASLQSLWAFNFGHPCPPSKKGEVLLLGQAEPTMVGIAPHPHHQ